MKTTTVALAGVSLLCLVSAQPFRARHVHQHEKKDITVQVYVDQNGVPVSTTTLLNPAPTPVVAAAVAPAASSAAPAKSAPSTTSGGKGSGNGFSYSPYYANNKIKSQADIDTDIKQVPAGYSVVRIYGTDQGQTAMVLKAAKANNLKLFCGIYDLTNVAGDINTIISDVGGDWGSIDTVAVGNELVNGGKNSADEVVAAIQQAKGMLTKAGYTGPVVTTDTLVATVNAPELCDKSDYCAVNCHPFFDGNTIAQNSGKFLTDSIANLRSKLQNKDQKIVISETGWPSQGIANKLAVPSQQNQQDAISSIKAAFSSNPSGVVLFMSYNAMWKTSTAAQFDAEQYWGFLGKSSVDLPSGQ